MKMTKSVIIVLAIALAAISGYALYLHKGPLENVYIENKELKTKLQEKVASLVKQLAQKTNEAQAYQEKNKQLTTAGVELQLKFEAQESRFIQKTGVLKGQLEAV